jgi:hypothetical protein
VRTSDLVGRVLCMIGGRELSERESRKQVKKKDELATMEPQSEEQPVKESGTERMTEDVGEVVVNYAKRGAPASQAKNRTDGNQKLPRKMRCAKVCSLGSLAG